jgi:hypothetical protein
MTSDNRETPAASDPVVLIEGCIFEGEWDCAIRKHPDGSTDYMVPKDGLPLVSIDKDGRLTRVVMRGLRIGWREARS